MKKEDENEINAEIERSSLNYSRTVEEPIIADEGVMYCSMYFGGG